MKEYIIGIDPGTNTGFAVWNVKEQRLEVVTSMKIHQAMEEMGVKIMTIEPGIAVLCDLCGEDYTNSDDKGGYIFANKAVCPKCADRFMESIKHHNEEQYITLRANKDESFRDFVYRVRSYE